MPGIKGKSRSGSNRNSIYLGNQRWQHRKKGIIPQTVYYNSVDEAWNAAGLDGQL